jgi:hypothetical protein
MKKSKYKRNLIIMSVLVVWIVIFSVDYSRAAEMKRPYFMIEYISKDCTSECKAYIGLGYWGSATRHSGTERLSNVEFNLLCIQLLHLFG